MIAFLKIVYPTLIAVIIGLVWFGMGFPPLYSSASDILPLIGILATPVILVLIALLVKMSVKTTLKLFNDQ